MATIRSDSDSTDPAQRLLTAAGPVFAQRGFDRAPVREIAKLAGVNVAAVSYYYGDKMGLYRAVIAAIRQNREAEFPAPILGQAPAEESLQRLIRTLLSRMLSGDESSWEAMLMMREMQQPTEALHDLIEDYFKPLYDAFCETVTELIEANHVHLPRSESRSPAGQLNQGMDEASDWRSVALVPQITLGVVGQCLYYRIGRPVIEQLIPSETQSHHYDLESLCHHITATTLAVCGSGSVIEHRLQLETMPAESISSNSNDAPIQPLNK